MGATFFYIFIFFVGYYGSNILNLLTVRPWITNRFIAALLPVYGIAMMHAYMIVTRPLPPGKDVSVEYALFEFVALPILLVTVGAIYFMWNSKGGQEEAETQPAYKKTQTDEDESENRSSSETENTDNTDNKETEQSEGSTEEKAEKSATTEADADPNKNNKLTS